MLSSRLSRCLLWHHLPIGVIALVSGSLQAMVLAALIAESSFDNAST
jgi:hypothetical protein